MTQADQTKSSIPGLRTFAKDLEKKRIPKPADLKITPTVPVPPTQQATKLPSAPAPIYEAPKWKTVEAKPVPPVKAAALPASLKTEKADWLDLKQAPSSLTTKESDIFIVTNGDAGEATIIRDTKSNRFRLFPEIIKSLTDWIERFKEAQKEKRKPKYAVPDSTHRKGVIQRATSKTGKVASFDALSIQERIREREAKVKPKIKEPRTFWTPNTEAGFELLEAPDQAGEPPFSPAPTNVVITPRKSIHTPKEEPPAPAPLATTRSERVEIPHKPMPTSRIATTFTFNQPASPELVEKTTQPKSPPPAPSYAGETPPQNQLVTPNETEKKFTSLITPRESDRETWAPESTDYQSADIAEAIYQEQTDAENLALVKPKTSPKSTKEWLLAENTNRLSGTISALVIIVIIIGAGLYWTVRSQTAELRPSQPYVFNNLLNTPLQPITITSLNRTNLITEIDRNVTESGYPVQQLVLVLSSPTGVGHAEPVSPSDILRALELGSNPNLALGLSELYFGSINQRPFIIMRSNNANAARGGMLAWENSLYSDLKELLKLAPVSVGQYRDVVIENNDTRIYRNPEDGTEIFLYGIVNDTTIIIAQNRVDFTTIANHLNPQP